MTSSFISPIAQQILPPKEKKKKNEKWKSQNRFFVIYFADDMLCSFVSNGDSFFLKAITYQLLQHHQSLSLTVVGYSRGAAAAAVTTNSFFDVSKTKQKSYTKFNRSETEKTPFQQATT
jgi:hypothetical protein